MSSSFPNIPLYNVAIPFEFVFPFVVSVSCFIVYSVPSNGLLSKNPNAVITIGTLGSTYTLNLIVFPFLLTNSRLLDKLDGSTMSPFSSYNNLNVCVSNGL